MSCRIEKTFHRYAAFAEESQKRSIGFHSKSGRIVDAWHHTTQSRFGRSGTALVTCGHDRRAHTFLHIRQSVAAGGPRGIRSDVRTWSFARSNGNNCKCHEKSEHPAASVRRIDTGDKNASRIFISGIAGWIPRLLQFAGLAQEFRVLDQFDQQQCIEQFAGTSIPKISVAGECKPRALHSIRVESVQNSIFVYFLFLRVFFFFFHLVEF